MIIKYNIISEAGHRLIKDWKKNAQNFRKLSVLQFIPILEI